MSDLISLFLIFLFFGVPLILNGLFPPSWYRQRKEYYGPKTISLGNTPINMNDYKVYTLREFLTKYENKT